MENSNQVVADVTGLYLDIKDLSKRIYDVSSRLYQHLVTNGPESMPSHLSDEKDRYQVKVRELSRKIREKTPDIYRLPEQQRSIVNGLLAELMEEDVESLCQAQNFLRALALVRLQEN